MFPFGEPVTPVVRVKRASPDELGNDVFDDVPGAAVRGAFDPGGSVEQVQGQSLVISQPSVYLPAGTDLSAVDALLIRGDTFEVDGRPSDWVNPFTGWHPGVHVKLRRVTG
jgi:hypothetical protein